MTTRAFISHSDKTGSSAAENYRVWLLGNYHPIADKSIDWDADPFPNLSDPDVLIVDLTTLDRQVLERIGRAKLEPARQLIWDKILNRGIVIVITRPFFWVAPGFNLGDDATHSPFDRHSHNLHVYSNYRILPTQLATKSVSDGRTIAVDPKHDFKAYADNIRSFSFFVEDYAPKFFPDRDQSSIGTGLAAVEGQGIKDNSGHDLGLTLTAVDVDTYRETSVPHRDAGRLVFLPPPTGSVDDAIGIILSACGKSAPHAETPPTWCEHLSLGKAGEYKAQIARMEEEKRSIQSKIDALDLEVKGILAHRRLLYSKGPELEDAVVQAFRALGFDDIAPMGGADEEDAAFAMNDGAHYSHAIVEIKGTDRGVQMQHILQCNRWTDQRAADGKKPSKGIFVANQHRLQPYPKSSKARVHIEPNQLDQAKLKDICIIPSCALFEAVRRVLGRKAPDRAEIAAKIADCRGVLTDVL